MPAYGPEPSARRPRLLVICERLGDPRDLWTQRQIAVLNAFEVLVVCWEVVDHQSVAPLTRIHCLQPPAAANTRAWHTWLRFPVGPWSPPGRERRQLVSVLRDFQPDLILCHSAALALTLAPLARQANCLFAVQLASRDQSPAAPLPPLLRDLHRRVGRQLARVFVTSSIQAAQVQALGLAPAKIVQIPCGAPTSDVNPKDHYAAETCRFVAVSRWDEPSGVALLLEAFAAARQTNPAIELHLGGFGPLEWQLRTYVATAGLRGAVHFHRVRHVPEARALLGQGDVYVHHALELTAGWAETIETVLAEATAAGLPVIASQGGATPDVVLDQVNGFLVPPRDVATLTRRMVQLAGREDLRAAYGRAGRQRACQELDCDVLARRLQEQLLAALRGDAAPAGSHRQ